MSSQFYVCQQYQNQTQPQIPHPVETEHPAIRFLLKLLLRLNLPPHTMNAFLKLSWNKNQSFRSEGQDERIRRYHFTYIRNNVF